MAAGRLPSAQPPTDTLPVVRIYHDGRRSVDLLRWGLVPWWARTQDRRALYQRDGRDGRDQAVRPRRLRARATLPVARFTSGRRRPPVSSLTRSWGRTAYRSPWRACGNAGRIGEREVNPDELRWMVLRPYLAGLMRAYPVGVRVGNVRNNDAALLDEISLAA